MKISNFFYKFVWSLAVIFNLPCDVVKSVMIFLPISLPARRVQTGWMFFSFCDV